LNQQVSLLAQFKVRDRNISVCVEGISAVQYVTFAEGKVPYWWGRSGLALEQIQVSNTLFDPLQRQKFEFFYSLGMVRRGEKAAFFDLTNSYRNISASQVEEAARYGKLDTFLHGEVGGLAGGFLCTLMEKEPNVDLYIYLLKRNVVPDLMAVMARTLVTHNRRMLNFLMEKELQEMHDFLGSHNAFLAIRNLLGLGFSAFQHKLKKRVLFLDDLTSTCISSIRQPEIEILFSTLFEYLHYLRDSKSIMRRLQLILLRLVEAHNRLGEWIAVIQCHNVIPKKIGAKIIISSFRKTPNISLSDRSISWLVDYFTASDPKLLINCIECLHCERRQDFISRTKFVLNHSKIIPNEVKIEILNAILS